MADCQIAVLRGDISDIILKKKDSYRHCTTLDKVEWICTVSLRLVELFSPYPQTLLNKHLKQVELWSRKQIKKQVCQKKDDTPAF